MASDDWPGTYELELLAAEIRLNDPRTQSIKLCDLDAKRFELTLANPPRPSPALVEAIARASRR